MIEFTSDEKALLSRLLLGHAVKSLRLADRAAAAAGYDDLRGKGSTHSERLAESHREARRMSLEILEKLA